jgi:hypothetical protein
MPQATERKGGGIPFHCPDCGSTAVQCQAWIDANTDEVFDDAGDYNWCFACEKAGWPSDHKYLCDCDDYNSHICPHVALINGRIQRCSVPLEWHACAIMWYIRHEERPDHEVRWSLQPESCRPRGEWLGHRMIPPVDLWED